MELAFGHAVCVGVAALAAAFGVAVGMLATRAAGRSRGARRLALREDRNGRALLELAAELEARGLELQERGQSSHAQRRWAAVCRRIAADHLATINFLTLHATRADDSAR